MPASAGAGIPTIEEFDRQQRPPPARPDRGMPNYLGPPLPDVHGSGIQPPVVSKSAPLTTRTSAGIPTIEEFDRQQAVSPPQPVPQQTQIPQMPSPVAHPPPVVQPGLPEEHDLHAVNQQRNALPPALRSAQYHSAETGPVSDLALQRTWALSRYNAAAPRIKQDIDREIAALNQAGAQLEKARAGPLTPQERQHYNNLAEQYKQRAAVVQARSDRLKHAVAEYGQVSRQEPALTQEDREKNAFKLADTTFFRDEVAQNPEHVTNFGFLESIVPGAGTREALRRMPYERGQLFLAGLAPKPLINPGRNPAERQQFTAQLADLRNKTKDYSNRLNEVLTPLVAAQGSGKQAQANGLRIRENLRQQFLQTLSPWQRSIWPQFKAHAAFEALAADKAGVSNAFASEEIGLALVTLLAPELAPTAERLVGKPLTALLGRALAKAGIEESLARIGGRKLIDLTPAVLKRFAIEKLPHVASHGAVGGVAGSAAAGVTGLTQGQTPGEALQTGIEAFPQMATFGGVMGLLIPTHTPEHPAVKSPARATTPRGEAPAHLNRFTIDGQEVHVRTHPPAELQRMQTNLAQRRQAGLTGHPEHVAEAVVGAHLEKHSNYLERQKIEFEDPKQAKQYTDSWGSMRTPERHQYDLFKGEADRVRETNPELATKLDAAKLQAQDDFSQRFRVQQEQKGIRDRKQTAVNGPAQASVWRHLTDEEKGQISPAAKKNLLLQDISNSNQVLNLGSLPENRIRGEQSLARIETEADRLYGQAEEAHHREITTAAHAAVGPEPAPSAVETAPLPPPVVEAPPTPVEAPPAPVEAPVPPEEKETASLAVPPEVKQIDAGSTHILAEGAKKAMLEAGVPENRIKWNKAEERYTITGKVSEALKKKLALAREIYENSTYEYTTPEGTTHHIKGLAVSHGTEPTVGEVVSPTVEVTPDVTVKPLWEMNLEELDAAYAAEKIADKTRLIEAFGEEGAKKYKALEKKRDSINSSFKDQEKAGKEIDAMEASLTKAASNKFFGVGDETHNLEDISAFRSALGSLDASSAEELGRSLMYAVTDIGDATDPTQMSHREQVAYAQLRAAKELAAKYNLDTNVVSKVAIQNAAERWPDANDAAFMLQRYLGGKGGAEPTEEVGKAKATETPAGSGALPEPPAQPTGATELGAPQPEPSVPVVAKRPARGRKAGGSAEPAVPPPAGGGTPVPAPEAREPAAGGTYQPGSVLKKTTTGLTLRLDEQLSDGRWKATVVEPGTLNVKKGHVFSPVGEDTLKDFKPVPERGKKGAVETLKQQLKSEEGSFVPPQKGQQQTGGPPPAKPPLPPGHVEDFGNPDEFFNEQNQKAFNRDREVKTQSFWQGAKQKLTVGAQNTANALTRAYEHLPNEPQFKEAQALLDIRRRSPDIARLKAQLQIGKALNGFTPEELQAFDSGWFSLAAREDIENQYALHLSRGYDSKEFKPVIPEGYTETGLNAAFDKTVEGTKGTGKVSRALSQMHDLQQEIWNDYRTAYERTTGRKMDSNLYFYLRHLINAYSSGENFVGPGKAIVHRPGYTLRRNWSPLSYSTNFMKATMDWMPHAIRETINLKLLSHVDEQHNIGPGVAFERIRRDTPDVHHYLITQAQSLTEEISHVPEAVHKLGELAHKDFLPDTVGGRFQPVIDGLDFHWQMNEERAANGLEHEPMAMTLNREVKKYARWLLEKEQTRKPIKGHEIPPGYREYPIENLQRIFGGFSVPERLGREAMQRATGELMQIPADQVKKALMVGRRRQPFIIPEGLAKTLDNLGVSKPDNFDTQINNVFAKAQQAWKWEALFNPFHLPQYVEKTFQLHLGPVLRKAPGAIKLVPWASRAVKEIGRNIAPEDPIIKAWIDRGGMGATQYRFEGMKSNPLTAPHNWRERVLRLSTFRHYVEQMQADSHGLPKDFAASNPEEVKALPTIYDRAWRLSQDLNIPYERTSAVGRATGKYLAPFWSVQEHIVRREGQFIKNAWNKPAIDLALGRKILGDNVGVARAADMGKFALKLGTAAAMFEGANYLTSAGREADSRMSLRDRFTPHITIGYDAANQTATTIPIFSNLFEAGRWFGVDHWPEAWDDYVNGRKTIGEIVGDMAISPVNLFYQAMGPQWKIPMEWIPGLRRFPDFRHPMPIHDRWEEAFRMVGSDGLYRMIRNYPQPKGYWQRQFFALRTIDLGQSAYNDILDEVSHFRQQEGLPGRGYNLSDSPRSLLFYRMRQALRLGDQQSAFEYLTKGATDKALALKDKDYVDTVMNAEPLRSITPESTPQLAKKFIDNLSSDDTQKLERAYQHWQMVYAPTADLNSLDRSSLESYIRTLRATILRDATINNPVRKAREENPEVGEEQRAAQREKQLLKR